MFFKEVIGQDANIRARIHFGEDVWQYKENPIFGSGKNNPFDQQFDPDYGKPRNGSYRR